MKWLHSYPRKDHGGPHGCPQKEGGDNRPPRSPRDLSPRREELIVVDKCEDLHKDRQGLVYVITLFAVQRETWMPVLGRVFLRLFHSLFRLIHVSPNILDEEDGERS